MGPGLLLASAVMGTPPARAKVAAATDIESPVPSPPVPPGTPPPPLERMLGAPPPPPPALVAGLRSLLSDLLGCDTPCKERGEDWFEQGRKWGAHSVQSMARLGLIDSFVGALDLPPEVFAGSNIQYTLNTAKPQTLQCT